MIEQDAFGPALALVAAGFLAAVQTRHRRRTS